MTHLSYARHRRPASALRRRALASGAAASLVAGGMALLPGSPAVAAVTEPCLKPRVADVMVSQGLPTYAKLVRGKSALVKLFMQVPSCAPVGTKMRVTSGELRLSGGATGAVPLASLPLSEIAPPSTAPIPSAQGDPLFLVPGSQLVPAGADAATVSFTATLGFTTTKADGTSVSDALTVTQRPDGTAISAVVEKASNPMRVLTVPMGDAGSFLLPNSASSQFDDADRAALTKGMTALNRVLPVADGVEALNKGSGGLRTTLSSGLLNVGPSMSGGQFCGTTANYSAVSKELNTARNNWNSVNPTGNADRVYGVISSRISQGGVTGNTSCADGYATIGGTVAWGRVVDATSSRPSITGAIAAMELTHTTGSVAEADVRYDGAYHSFNKQADVTKPDRAWNVPDKSWLQNDASSLNYQLTGWNDGTSLLERPDFDTLHCQLTPLATGATSACPSYGPVGRAGAIVGVGSSFFLSGSTNGTPGGTDAHTHIDDDVNYEQPFASSEFRFVQRDASGAIVANDGFRVTYDHSHHDGVPGPGRHDVGSFGTELQADSRTDRLELWKGNPGSPGSVLLHARDEDAAPQFLAASVQGRTVTVNVRDGLPQNLRLDVFHVCPGAVSPIVNAAKPLTAAAGIAAFTVTTDTSLGCPTGTLRYRVSDGYLVAEQDDAIGGVVGGATPTAAIYAPVFDSSITTKKVIGLAGDGRDELGQSAAVFDWTLQGPSFPTATKVATGSSTAYVPPAAGLLPGTYVLSLQAKRADGSVLATASKSLVALLDTDGDGIADRDENQPCFPAGSVTSQANAVLDSDFDGFDNSSDPAPCSSANNAVAQFTATSFNTGANGNTVMLKLSESIVDLRTITKAQVAITQVAGHRLERPIPALTWAPESATIGKATFDRQLLSSFITAMGISGQTPIFVTAPAAGFRAGDAQAPNTF